MLLLERDCFDLKNVSIVLQFSQKVIYEQHTRNLGKRKHGIFKKL